MILLYGRLDDPPFTSTVEALQIAGAEYVLLDQTTLDREALCIEVGPAAVRGALVVAGQQVPLDSLHSVYARPLELPGRRRDPGAALIHEQLLEWLDVAPALVVNRPRAMQANASKPLQIQLIGEAGFVVPDTLVTSDPDEARAFWREHGRIVYKSVSGVRSIVQEMDERAGDRLDRLRALPVQFQALVPGIDVRVHVVGDRAFAAEIVGSGVDYRYSARNGGAVSMSATTLPRDVARRCVTLSQQMGLALSGIDLRRRPDGAFVCFEVNPMPAYTYFETHSGLPISSALAELLIHGAAETSEVMDGTRDREPHVARRNDRRVADASAVGRL